MEESLTKNTRVSKFGSCKMSDGEAIKSFTLDIRNIAYISRCHDRNKNRGMITTENRFLIQNIKGKWMYQYRAEKPSIFNTGNCINLVTAVNQHNLTSYNNCNTRTTLTYDVTINMIIFSCRAESTTYAITDLHITTPQLQ